jgi:hypothetical protein
MTKRNRELGQTAILYTLGLTTLFGLVGLVSDVGFFYYRKQYAQAAAQAAALAALKTAYTTSLGSFTCGTTLICTTAGSYGSTSYTCPSSITGTGSDNMQVGCLYAQKNGYSGNQVWFEANTGSISGVYANYWVAAHVREQLPLLMLAVTGKNKATVASRTIAAYIPGGGGCIYALDNNIADVGTLTTNGSASLTSGCGVWVDGPNANALNLNGGGTITISSAGQGVNIVGGYTCAGGVTTCVSPTPITGADPTGDPLQGLSPPSDPGTCGTVTWTNGNKVGTVSNPTGGIVDICGGLSITNTDTFTFPPGIYIFTGCNNGGNQGLGVNGGTVTGTEVSFYFKNNCSPQITGQPTVTLTAPTSGTYNGVLMYEDPSDTASPQLTGGASQILNGIVYAPTQNLSYAGGSSSSTYSQFLSIIAWQIKITGSSYIQNSGNSPYLNNLAGFKIIE